MVFLSRGGLLGVEKRYARIVMSLDAEGSVGWWTRRVVDCAIQVAAGEMGGNGAWRAWLDSQGSIAAIVTD